MKKVLFIDRDGTIISEPADEQVDSFEKLEFLPGAISGLSKIANDLDYELVMVTNQDGLGTDLFPEETFWPVHNKMLQILKAEGVLFTEIFIDRSLPEDNAPTRKPGIAMLTKYLKGDYDLSSSYIIGDRLTDIQLAKNLGCKVILFGREKSEDAALVTASWNDIYKFLKTAPRIARVERKTIETNIIVEVNLDGSGKSDIDSGIGLFDHLLEQISRHGNLDITLSVRGS